MPASDTWLAALTRAARGGFVSGWHLRPSAAAGRRERADPPLSGAVVCDVFQPDERSPRASAELEALTPLARSPPVHVRQRLLVHPAIGLGAASVSRDADWRGRRVGARRAACPDTGLAYVPDAVVVHSHERSASYEFDRTCVLHRPAVRAVRRPDDSDARPPRASDRHVLVTHAAPRAKRPRDGAGVRVAARSVHRRAVGGQGPEWRARRGSPDADSRRRSRIPANSTGRHRNLRARPRARARGAWQTTSSCSHESRIPSAPSTPCARNGATACGLCASTTRFDNTRTFEETYANGTIDAIAESDSSTTSEPDVAHIHHLTCLSTTIVRPAGRTSNSERSSRFTTTG